LLNSKEILERTGISRATLNNYIGWGIVPRPDVLPPGPDDGEAPRLGYFPDDIVERVAQIQRLKKDGWSMARIASHFGGKQPATEPSPATPLVSPAAAGVGRPPRDPSAESGPVTDASLGATPRGLEHTRRRSPGLTEVAVLVAGLHHSTRIWSDLPPEEYFELINDIWSTADPIFRRHAGSHGKHPADGMVCYFFPLPSGSYLSNALAAAQELREAMRRVSKQWQLRKGWTIELYLNVGIDEGREWLGPFKSTSAVEFTAMAETIKRAARISDFSRFGAIWVTKNLIGKLPLEELRRLKYGVHRKNNEGQHVFVPFVFSTVQRLTHQRAAVDEQLQGITALPITEIVELTADPRPEPSPASRQNNKP
jgi:class 3 adenylate cyclase